jgi:hypothetical protein
MKKKEVHNLQVNDIIGYNSKSKGLIKMTIVEVYKNIFRPKENCFKIKYENDGSTDDNCSEAYLTLCFKMNQQEEIL